ncbi:MAG: hypothetical protein AAFR77_11260 [Cyanobacteria bacterium J06631_2]
MVEKITSVGQIHNIIQKALKAHNDKSLDVWASIFDTKNNNKETIIKITELFVLFGQAKEEVCHLDDYQKSLALNALNRIEKSISKNINQSWILFTKDINPKS